MLRVNSMKLLNGRVVNFELSENEGVLLVGENGSGKSLLLKSIARLSEVSSEKFEYRSENASQIPVQEYRRKVMYVSTSSHVSKSMSVEEFFTSILKFEVYKNFTISLDYKEVLTKWKIPLNDLSVLSSGQRQMISILRALALNPEVLLLDEPTANLDHEKTKEVEALVLDWMKEHKRSVIWVSHSPEQIERLGFRKYSLA